MTKKGLPLRLLVPGVILLVIILCSLFMTIYSYFAHHNATVESYGTQAMRMAQTLASVIEPEGFARIVETRVQDDYWHQVQDALDRIINETGVQFVYALFPTYDGGYVTYFGAGLAAHHEWGVYFGMQDPVEYFSDEMFQALRDGVATKSGIYDGGDAIGLLIGGFAPIIDSAGNVVGLIAVEIDVNDVIAAINAHIFTMALFAISLIMVFIVISMLTIRKTLTKPLGILTQGVADISAGDLTGTIQVASHNEIQTLADSFNAMTKSLREHIENMLAIRAENERISTELNIATQIQSDMLPNVFPAFPERSEFEIHATMHPAKEVGGDFYDFFLVDDNHLCVVMADVSGKGVPAALFMVIAKTLINNRARYGEGAHVAFANANNQLCEGNESAMFVTAWMGILEISTGIMTCVNAGHNPPVLRKANGQFEYLKMKRGPMLAMMSGINYKSFDVQLHPGDMLFLYTDGVTEAHNTANKLYGEDRLLDALNHLPDPTPKTVLKHVKEDIDKFAENTPQFDDITMLGLFIN